MNQLSLPLCKPSVISYLHHANPLAIIETRREARDYLVNDFIQLVGRPQHQNGVAPGLNVDFYSHDGMYPRYPLLSQSWLSGTTLRCLGPDLIGQIIALLEQGHYVEALLDEFYVPNRIAYQRMHYLHQNLIYGYDRDAAVFYTQGFDAQWAFVTMRLGFDEVKNSFVEGSGLALFRWHGHTDFGRHLRYSPARIRTSLSDYLARRTSFLSYQPDNVRYGQDCYAVAQDLLRQQHGEQIDIRPWCVFHEHKQKLLQLARYLQERELPVETALLADLGTLADDFLTLRNYILEAKLAGDSVDCGALDQEIEYLIRHEQALLERLLKALP